MIEIASPQSQTSRSTLIAAFRRVVAINGRRQATDLHVRRLLCYVRAKDVDGQGTQRSLEQIANRLVLSVSTCRRVIRRAVKRFGLLIVIPQRHTPGGQTVNRYTINWHHVDKILGATGISSSAVQFACAARTPIRHDLAPGARCDQPPPDRYPSTRAATTLADSLVVLRPRTRERSELYARAARTRFATTSHRMLSAINRYQTSILAPGLLPLWPIRLSCYAPHPPVRCDQPLDHNTCQSGSDPVRLAPDVLVGSSDRFSSTTAFPQRATPRIPCPLRSAAGPHQLPVRLAPQTGYAKVSQLQMC